MYVLSMDSSLIVTIIMLSFAKNCKTELNMKEITFCITVTVDESWMFHFDQETRQQSSHWKSPASPTTQKAKVVKKCREMYDDYLF